MSFNDASRREGQYDEEMNELMRTTSNSSFDEKAQPYADSTVPSRRHRYFGTLVWLPARANWLRIGWLAFFAFLVYSLYSHPVHTSTSHPDKPHDEATVKTQLHPIEKLVAVGREKATLLEGRQSKELSGAVAEYRKRYGRRPPPRFPEWFKLAQEKGLVLIDEFDVLMQNLEPFWGIHPITLAGRMKSRSEHGFGNTHVVNFANGVITNSTDNWQIDVMKEWLSELPWQNILHNVTILVHAMDEPTISVPLHVLKQALLAAAGQQSAIDGRSPELPQGDELIYSHNFHAESAWPYLRDACDPAEPALSPGSYVAPSSLPFISNITEAMDPCLNPYHATHGAIWHSPSNLLLTKHLVPVLAQSTPSRFNDILWPSPFYHDRLAADEVRETDRLDRPWEERHNRVYWVGSANAGVALPASWREMQRQRMVLLVKEGNMTPVELFYKEVSSGFTRWLPRVGKAWSDLAVYFHLRVGLLGVCENEACAQQEAEFQPAIEPISESYSSKYCLDMDGMGFSGRYHRLLRSHCAVMKQTVLREWSDDWLVPWVHYIPLSLEAKEFGEMARFLIDEDEGREIGRRIAEDGRAWSRRILRNEDFELYFLRLLMEMERLLDPNRNNLYYEG
ncbi:hypothetical protein B9Z65_1371 [Elsinoe australis]|uniref:Glycosyl transferase CAP10 domain-containing protein n=1 Tax=Elsinoe australis TaxID=40998 RepID=A0A2P7YFP6_9PEZI|nr:hypothetical protein B9Z65_1371 [Elsinoe australis]